MSKKITADIYKLVHNKNTTQAEFSQVLIDYYSRINDNLENKTFLMQTKNKKDISIYFDSLDNIDKFTNEIFENTICFLLAKDIDCLYENKKEGYLDNKNNDLITTELQPKLPTHCIYFIDTQILIIQNSSDGVTIQSLLKGLKNNMTKFLLEITPKQLTRNDALEQLKKLINRIEKIEIKDLKLAKYLNHQDNGDLFDILNEKTLKFYATLDTKDQPSKLKNIAFKLFENSLNKNFINEFENIKITCKNNNNENEIFDLVENLLKLKITVENDLSDYYDKKSLNRLEDSIIIYEELIKAYLKVINEQN